MWLAVAPLVAQRYNTVAPIGLLLMPPLVVLTSVALLSGFLLLLTAMVCPPLAGPLAWATRWCLTACDGLVNLADRCPGGHWYVTDMPAWWLWGLYAVLLAVVMLECLRRYRRWFALAGLAWLCVGLLGGAAPRSSDELRARFWPSATECVRSSKLRTDGSCSTMPGPWAAPTSPSGKSRRSFGSGASVALMKYSCPTPTWIISMVCPPFWTGSPSDR